MNKFLVILSVGFSIISAVMAQQPQADIQDRPEEIFYRITIYSEVIPHFAGGNPPATLHRDAVKLTSQIELFAQDQEHNILTFTDLIDRIINHEEIPLDDVMKLLIKNFIETNTVHQVRRELDNQGNQQENLLIKQYDISCAILNLVAIPQNLIQRRIATERNKRDIHFSAIQSYNNRQLRSYSFLPLFQNLFSIVRNNNEKEQLIPLLAGKLTLDMMESYILEFRANLQNLLPPGQCLEHCLAYMTLARQNNDNLLNALASIFNNRKYAMLFFASKLQEQIFLQYGDKEPAFRQIDHEIMLKLFELSQCIIGCNRGDRQLFRTKHQAATQAENGLRNLVVERLRYISQIIDNGEADQHDLIYNTVGFIKLCQLTIPNFCQ